MRTAFVVVNRFSNEYVGARVGEWTTDVSKAARWSVYEGAECYIESKKFHIHRGASGYFSVVKVYIVEGDMP